MREEYTITVENDNYIGIVLSKAVSNAIKHANKFDPAKKVRLKVETKNDRYLCFTIKGEGASFDSTIIADPTSPERIAEPNGKGVFLINKLADIVKYTENGTCLEIGFDIYKIKITSHKKVIYLR